jgi:hypothetical protein
VYHRFGKSIAILSLAAAVPVGAALVSAEPAGASTVVSGPGGPGSIALSISTPTVHTGHIDTPVACSTGPRYVARIAKTTSGGHTITASVITGGYVGPGSYVGSTSVSVVGDNGEALYHATKTGVPISITSTGGTYTYHSPGTRDHPVTISLTWACS